MTLPAWIFAWLLASLYASVYHLVRGGDWKRLLLFLVLAWFGFAAGHWLGVWRGWIFLQLGTINLGAGTVGSYLCLGIGDWLSRREGRQ